MRTEGMLFQHFKEKENQSYSLTGLTRGVCTICIIYAIKKRGIKKKTYLLPTHCALRLQLLLLNLQSAVNNPVSVQPLCLKLPHPFRRKRRGRGTRGG